MDGAVAMRCASLMVLVLACVACSDELPPLGEALFIVDTDLPVPLLAGALRLDVYSADGSVWYESREIPRPDPRDWPASFSVYNPGEEGSRAALVRVRVYANGKTRDYRGERFAELPLAGSDPAAPFGAPPLPGELPRLVRDGLDVTPPEEPQPFLTIDRLVLVDLEEGRRGSVRLLMSSNCLGTMADVAGRRSCIDTHGELVALAPAVVNDDMSRPTESQQGGFDPNRECTAELRSGGGSPQFSEEICVDGGVFIFGNSDNFGVGDASGIPERVVRLPPFVVDRYEVTVARWRQALAEGFASPDATPIRNEAPINPSRPANTSAFCTYSDTPQDREDYPVNCVNWEAGREFCRFRGGDLLSEAQWEYVSQVAGRATKTRYPWGADDPNCGRAVYGRTDEEFDDLVEGYQCLGEGEGPQPVDMFATELGDASLGLGVFGLGGSMAEMLRDAYLRLDTNCWAQAATDEPVCDTPDAPVRSLRGGSWVGNSVRVYAGLRQGRRTEAATWMGVRCARPADD
jgi:formylglycine-generating enzyme required for sulfatase activity